MPETSVEATAELSPTAKRALGREPRRKPIKVLLIGPSLDILGGQAVQATRLMSVLSQLPQLAMTFFPINPRPPKGLGWVRKVPYLRTLADVWTLQQPIAARSAQTRYSAHLLGRAFVLHALDHTGLLVGRLIRQEADSELSRRASGRACHDVANGPTNYRI